MLRCLMKNLSHKQHLTQLRLLNRCLSKTTDTCVTTPEQWDIFAGVLLERLPVISKELQPLEMKFQEVLWRIEFENSLKSDYELRHEREVKQAELIKKGKVEVDLEETASQLTAQDLKDAYVEELKQFQFAPRTTADDAKNNTVSINRCLDETLYLLLEQQYGKQKQMLLPQGLRYEGESMRQAAERVLREQCGDKLRAQFYGNIPCGFHKYKYPAAVSNNKIGAKVFFYRATLQHGTVAPNDKQKFQWLPKTALGETLRNSSYAHSVQKFLL